MHNNKFLVMLHGAFVFNPTSLSQSEVDPGPAVKKTNQRMSLIWNVEIQGPTPPC